ncbi:MAG: response regulator [Bacteroidales bacterium]|jgi:DNA-binding NtrC family response regulator|nr:response regulator [Bacteroidales bacterium]
MSGIKINICFWYIDDSLVEEIVAILIEGNYELSYCTCKDQKDLRLKLSDGSVDLVMADFDLPDALRTMVEEAHKTIASHIPLIYLVGERNELKAAETLKRGVWDYILKSHFVKLISTVYSSQ